MQLDVVSNLFSAIYNAERVRKKECLVNPISKFSGNILRILQKEGYVGEFEYIDDNRGGKFRIQLLGRVNKCGAIRPRFPVGVSDLIDHAKRLLPSRDIGIIIISTPLGLMTHRECLEKNVGGVLIGYVY
ncbi:MAG: 30S ribosomal protein S8 [Candidatus Geothermarchaeales archaeon]